MAKLGAPRSQGDRDPTRRTSLTHGAHSLNNLDLMCHPHASSSLELPQFGIPDNPRAISRDLGNFCNRLCVAPSDLQLAKWYLPPWCGRPCSPLCDVQSHRRQPQAAQEFPGKTGIENVGI